MKKPAHFENPDQLHIFTTDTGVLSKNQTVKRDFFIFIPFLLVLIHSFVPGFHFKASSRERFMDRILLSASGKEDETVFRVASDYHLQTEKANNETTDVKEHLRNLGYFARLLKFGMGLLGIIILAQGILLVIYIGKLRKKNHLLARYQHQPRIDTSVQAGSAVATTEKGIAIREQLEKGQSHLETEVTELKEQLAREQELRKRMEDEINALLSRIRGS